MIDKNNFDSNEKKSFHVQVFRQQTLSHSFNVGDNKGPSNFGKDFIVSANDMSSFDLYLKVSFRDGTKSKIVNLFKSGHLHDNSTDMVFVPKLNLPYSSLEYQEFNIIINDPKGRQYILFMKWKLQANEPNKELIFKFKKAPFENEHILNIINDYNAFDLKNSNFSNQRGECIRAQHLVSIETGKSSDEIFKCEILHIPSIQWSSIRILHANEKQLKATSHLIGLAQLPMYEQLQDPQYPLGLNPQFEKAMLVRNGKGDYAIVKGKWVGFRRGVPPNARSKRGIPGDPGHLQLKIYFFDTKMVYKFDISSNFKFEIKTNTIKAAVELQTGKFSVNSIINQDIQSNDVASLLATVFSISTLHVLLQPKQNPLHVTSFASGLKKATPSSSTSATVYRGRRPVRSINIDDYLLFSIVGYNDLIHSDCYIHYCHLHNHHNNHHHEDSQNDCNNFEGQQNEGLDNKDQWMFNDCENQETNDSGFSDGGSDSQNDNAGIDPSAGCGG